MQLSSDGHAVPNLEGLQIGDYLLNNVMSLHPALKAWKFYSIKTSFLIYFNNIFFVWEHHSNISWFNF